MPDFVFPGLMSSFSELLQCPLPCCPSACLLTLHISETAQTVVLELPETAWPYESASNSTHLLNTKIQNNPIF